MKSWKKYWLSCNPYFQVVLPMFVLFLAMLPLSISPTGIRWGTAVLPVRMGADMIQTIYGSIFAVLLPFLTWISLILYAGETNRPLLRLAGFQFAAAAVILVPLVLKLRRFPPARMILVTVLFLITLDGILKLISWLFRGSRTAASVVLACVQLAGPLIIYLNDFRDFFPAAIARMASIVYLEFPFYRKATGLLKGGSLSPMVPDLILAIVVVGVAAVLKLRNRGGGVAQGKVSRGDSESEKIGS